MKVDRTTVGGEPAWNRYFHSKGAALGIPTAGNFELTGRCNFSCKMCYVHNDTLKNELSADEWLRIGREAVAAGMIFLLITGGEPLTRPDFREIYTGLRKMGLLISINTNGYLLDDDYVAFFAKDKPVRMNISLYGTSNEAYRSLCGVPAYDRVMHNVRALKEAGIPMRLNSSITPYNCDDVHGLYEAARSIDTPLKATSYMFPPVRVNGCKFGDAPHRFSPEEAARIMLVCREHTMTSEQLAATATGGRVPSDDECTDGTGDRMKCRSGRSAFWVTSDGRMLPCGMFPWQGYDLRQMSFDAAWAAVRRDVDAMRMPAKCSGCELREKCTVCAAACMTETGACDVAPEYICAMTETLERLTYEKYGKTSKGE